MSEVFIVCNILQLVLFIPVSLRVLPQFLTLNAHSNCCILNKLTSVFIVFSVQIEVAT